ncbi:MAG TPA: PAS domain-containing protein [Flavobacterium sp.]|jgi:signal transduction histidine kinase
MVQWDDFKINQAKFSMKVLPSYAAFLLANCLDKYVLTMIEYSRQEDLPLLRKLDKLTDGELLELGKVSHAEVLQALATETIHLQIQQNVSKWVANKLEVIDKDEVVAEDVTLSAFIKRKCLQSFIATYTDDFELQGLLREEIDHYTTQEELISYNIYLKLQQDKLNKINDALQFQESLLLEAQDLSELGSFIIDYQNPENSVSTPQMQKITGLQRAPEDEFFSYVHPEDLPLIRSAWERAVATGSKFQYTFRYKKDGTEKKLESRGIVTKENDKVKFVKGTLRDITQNAELIRRLTESESLHKEAQKLTHLGNWSWDIETNVIEWSDEMYRIHGLEPQSETITFERYISLIHPDNREERINAINESLVTGIVKDYTLKIMTPSGEIKILRGFGDINKTADGKPMKLVGTCQDITEEFHLKNDMLALNKELSVKNDELMRSNKELESFNYIVSHDLQEPLRKIQLYIEKIIHQTESLSAGARTSLEKVIRSADRMRILIKDLMEFSQISLEQPALKKMALDAIFEDAMETFAEAVEQGHATFFIDTLPEARVIPFQFRQLVTNLIANAIKYRKQDQVAIIRVTSVVLPAETLDFADAKGHYLKISISDNGIGFDTEQREKIFDLFKRLHSNEAYSGTGIGLAICKKIMQNHNGYITADGIPDNGSTFNIYLPFH